MSDILDFDRENYTVETCVLGESSVEYRAFMGIAYCQNPVAPVQKLNLFVPELYYRGKTKNGYGLHTAPIFMPNTVGGYMEGPADEPGTDRFGRPNAVFRALEHGYVVACAGVRGRTTGKRSTEFFEGAKGTLGGEETGRMVGKAPALVVDMKAAVRYLRHNRERIPGDTERIITSGTSAGGALSALMGATGNHPDYEPYLAAIGAAEERDDIFAANCYCPIHNLENADNAYEWQFHGYWEFYRTKHVKTEKGVERVPYSGVMTEKERAVSADLKKRFPVYLNGLHLTDENGQELTLEEDGTGSFREYVKRFVMASAQRELETHDSAVRLGWLSTAGSQVDEQDYLTVKDGCVTDLDWENYIRKITRMKAAPAFDALDSVSLL